MRGLYRGCAHAGTGLLALLAVVLTGCGQNYKQNSREFAKAYREGDFQGAYDEARRSAKEAPGRDKLVWLLEEGSTGRAAGDTAQSNQALEKAENLFDRNDEKAKVRISREAAATILSPAAVEYEGQAHQRIMTVVYQALNNLEAGRADDARQAIIRIADAQERSEERNANNIKEAEKEKGQDPNYGQAITRVQQQDGFKQGSAQFLADFPDVQSEPLENLSHKALYVNPFAEYLQGLFFLHSSAPGDAEKGRQSIRAAAGMVPGNRNLLADVEYAEKVASGSKPGPRTYVVFETGMAPFKQEIRIDVPLFVLNLAWRDTKVDYVGLAFPVLKKRNDFVPYLAAATPDGSYQTAVVADMDRIVAREFKDELPGIIVRTVISAVIKAAEQYAVAKSLEKQSAVVQVLGRGLNSLWQAALNEADVRCWKTLPKQIQVASFPTPSSGQVSLSLPNGRALQTVTVPAGKSCLIWVKTPGNGPIQPTVRQVTLD